MRFSIALIAAASFADALLIPNLQSLLFLDWDHDVPNLARLLRWNMALPPLPISDSASDSSVRSLDPHLAPLSIPNRVSDVYPHRYIVLLKDDLSESDISEFRADCQQFHIASNAPQPSFFSLNTLVGFIGDLSPDLLRAVRKDSRVRLVEQDAIFSVDEFDVQKEAPWGLDRVSHRSLSAPKPPQYLYDDRGGLGVNAYVIDTGIKVEHPLFEGRARWGLAIAFPKLPVDGHGHGTHCAGTIGSRDYGIAKKVNLIAVGVMSPLGTGSTSDIIKGLEFVVSDHRANVAAKKKGFKGSVVNMSIGGGASDALDLAANAAANAGVHIAVAAGNENGDACLSSPARASKPITVGAAGPDDSIASFSNWGKCVDVFAPGVDIKSTFTWQESTLMSGTSMASPHVAGLLAYFLSFSPDAGLEFSLAMAIDPESLKKKLVRFATKDAVRNLKPDGSPNVLVYNGAGANISHFWQ